MSALRSMWKTTVKSAKKRCARWRAGWLQKFKKYGRSVVLEPMNPYERRIIHAEVQEIEGVSTSSIGSDSNRKVVLFPTDQGMGKTARPHRQKAKRRTAPRTRNRAQAQS